MIARFASTCPACRGRIRKGETIAKTGRRYVCAECAVINAECANAEPTYKERYGRCEDAPCCGCCGETGYGYATVIGYR